MKRKFTKLLAAIVLLVFMTPNMVAWGQTKDDNYTISFANNSSSATAISTTTGATTTIAENSRKYVTSTPYSNISGNCYYGGSSDGEKESIRVGKSGNDASITIALSENDGQVTATSIVVNCMRMSGNKNVGATLSVNEMAAQTAPDDSAGDLTFTFDSSTDIESIVLTSVKAVFVYSITVNYTTGGGGSSGTITISNPSISVDYEEHTYETFGGSFSGINSPVFQIQYYESAETNAATTSEPSWIETYAYQNGSGVVDGYCIIDENPGTTRYAYFKVYSGTVYSNIVTVTQSAAPTPNITIPAAQLSLSYEEDADGNFDITYANYTPAVAYATLYTDSGCTNAFPTTGSGAWIVLDDYDDPYSSLSYILEANPTAIERNVYLKIEATNANNNDLDAVFTITQAGAPTYTVTYNANGATSGTVPTDNTSYVVGSSVTVASNTGNLAKTGHTFGGWNTQADGTGTDYAANNTFNITANTTLYAQWTPNTHTVTLPTANIYGTYTMNKSNPVAYGTEVTLTYTPAAGYEGCVATWSVNGAAISGNKFNMPDEDVTVTVAVAENSAVFTDGLYSETMTTSASFDNMEVVSVTGDGTWTFNSTYKCAFIKYSNAQEDWLITPKMHVDNGKLNVGFSIYHKNLEDNGITLKWANTNNTTGTWHNVEFDKQGASAWRDVSNLVIETGNAENVYLAFVFANENTADAQCQIKNLTVRQYYSVTFDANNASASGTMAAQACPAGVATALNSNAFSATGKTFTGWNTAANGSGTAYADGANITITVNTTLYAQWADAYTVSFTTNGIADGSVQVAQGQAIGTLPTPTAEYIPSGYEFTGWLATDYAVSNTAPSEYITAPYQPSSDVTLKAVFAQVSGSSSSMGSLTEAEIKSNFTSSSQAYADTEVEYDDSTDGITWAARGSWSSGRPWIQIRSNTTPSYIKITAADNISQVVVTITSATNSSGGQDDITKHTDFSSTGSVYLNTEANSSTHITETSGSEIVNDVVTINPTGNNSTLYLQVSTPARIWGISVTSGSSSYSNYRTSLTINSGEVVVGTYSSTKDGYKLIASPVYVDPDNVSDMTTGNFDLYYFDQNESEEWRNYEVTHFNLVPGKGYLYAKQDGVTLSFTGAPYNGDGVIALDFADGQRFAGWNLIGNPHATMATIDKAYYRLNSEGSALNASTEETAVDVMEGVFVQATAANQTATFTQSRGAAKQHVAQTNIRVINNSGSVIDNAIVRFDEGQILEKFMFRADGTKIFFTEDHKDYAIVRSNGQGQLPVNFKAAENGTYTISVETENLDVNYLHLIDNITGMDVDLLATPSYTFEGKRTDYASRFRLVFDANAGNNEDNEEFAFISDGNIVITNNGEATLQVIDMLGRIVSSQTVNGNASIDKMNANGVYVLRLINGNNVKTQKIVVK